MKKNYFLAVLLLICSIGAHAQQILKRVTQTDTQVVVELFTFSNGTIPTVITGPNHFISGILNSYFAYYAVIDGVITPLSHIGSTYGQGTTPPPISLLGTEFTFSNTVGFFMDSTAEGIVVYDGETEVSSTVVVPIATYGHSSAASTTIEGLGDLYYAKFFINKTLSNGGAIPAGTCLKLVSPTYMYPDANNVMLYFSDEYYMTFNGTNWVEQYADCLGNPANMIPDLGATLSLTDVEAVNNRLLLYPNPSLGNVYIDSVKGQSGNFTFKIIDYTGRSLQSGVASLGKNIATDGLPTGNYIIQINLPEGKQQVIKFTKK